MREKKIIDFGNPAEWITLLFIVLAILIAYHAGKSGDEYKQKLLSFAQSIGIMAKEEKPVEITWDDIPSTTPLPTRAELAKQISETCPQPDGTAYSACLITMLAQAEKDAELALNGKLSAEWKEYRDLLCEKQFWQPVASGPNYEQDEMNRCRITETLMSANQAALYRGVNWDW